MDGIDSYTGIISASEGLYKDKGSRFIAYAYPVASESEVKPLVDALKKEHHAAKHHCFAYRLGAGRNVFRVSDDGEPSGTAGRPILAAIDSVGVSDALVVVVRYFGGILLGVPGLIQAYREAAADALSKAGKVERFATASFELEFAYEEMNTVLKLMKQSAGVEIKEQKFDLQCLIKADVRLSAVENFIETIKNTNNERGTRIQCRPVQAAPTGD